MKITLPRLPGDIARVALVAFGVIAASVTVVAVVESYSNLLAFALAYGLSGWRAAIAPGAVDSFIVMGEMLLFAAILLRWGRAPHGLGVGMAVWGFLLSVGGNVWHAHTATSVDRAVAAVWPVTATAALAGALLIVRQVTMSPEVPVTPGAPVPSGGAGPALPAPAREQEPPPVPRAAGAARRGRSPVVAADPAWLDELLAAGLPMPSFRSFSMEKTGRVFAASAKRVYDEARARLEQDQERAEEFRPDQELVALNGAGPR